MHRRVTTLHHVALWKKIARDIRTHSALGRTGGNVGIVWSQDRRLFPGSKTGHIHRSTFVRAIELSRMTGWRLQASQVQSNDLLHWPPNMNARPSVQDDYLQALVNDKSTVNVF